MLFLRSDEMTKCNQLISSNTRNVVVASSGMRKFQRSQKWCGLRHVIDNSRTLLSPFLMVILHNHGIAMQSRLSKARTERVRRQKRTGSLIKTFQRIPFDPKFKRRKNCLKIRSVDSEKADSAAWKCLVNFNSCYFDAAFLG